MFQRSHIISKTSLLTIWSRKPCRTLPDYASYHRSLTEELYSLKDRIRNLVSHWPTDGEHKEVALRSILRRHLPQSLIVGRGFIVGPDWSSTQTDVLIVDANKPTLFRDSDLPIVTPDAVAGVIEVKTKLRTEADFLEAISKLTTIERDCRQITFKDSIWSGLFVFECDDKVHQKVLSSIAQSYLATGRAIDSVCCGRNSFVKYWDNGMEIESPIPGAIWHSYDLPDMAPSYFLGNLVDSVSSIDDNSSGFAWFPMIGGKEMYRNSYVALGQNVPLNF